MEARPPRGSGYIVCARSHDENKRLMMHIDQQKEQFSKAFVHAIATVAGYAIYKPEVDDDSVDLGIAARGGISTLRRPRLEMQIKCTQNDEGPDEYLSFDLKRKNYNDLRVETIVPRLLVVVLVPPEVREWLRISAREMCLHQGAYWVSLAGQPETTNKTSVTIHLPRSQQLTPEGLQQLMARINNGDLL